MDADLRAAIATTRFGLGSRRGEIDAATPDPVGFLKAQIRPAGADQPVGDFKTGAAAFTELREYQTMRRDAKAAGDPKADPVKMAQKLIRETAGEEFLARMRLGCSTDAAFRERWALFWFNHFTVAANKVVTAPLVGPFEREAIRPHMFGRFEDLLVASTTHPAMLLYLNEEQSIGPNSPVMSSPRYRAYAGKGPRGLNENLAREIMELHTLGVGSGYTQTDVTEFARALTGWSIIGLNGDQRGAATMGGKPGDFAFRPMVHEPGSRTILGQTYRQEGIAQAGAVLHTLAAHPATAHHIAVKLARHFVADDPPPALVARLERTFRDTDGRLDKVAETLVAAPEAWAPEQRKFKTPYEFLVSGYRAVGLSPTGLPQVGPTLTGLGQQPFNAPSPKGWPEEAAAWAAPDGVMKRIGWSEAFAAAVEPVMGQPIDVAKSALGARLSPPVATAIAHAESRHEALAILLMSPEFQRR
jgi:uncharacterized protein (DUF1800 family)